MMEKCIMRMDLDTEDNDNNDAIDDEKVDWASLGRIRRARPPL